MKRQVLKVKPYRHSPTHPWVIDAGKVNGKRKRFFFKTREAAELEASRMSIKLTREGNAALNFTDNDRVDALRAKALLEPYGKTLVDAARFLATHLEINQKAITVSELTQEYLQNQKRLGRSHHHFLDMRWRLARFCESFGQRQIRTLTRPEIEQWLYRLKGSPVSINAFTVRLGVLFNFAIKRAYLEKNPVAGIDQFKQADKPVEIFTVDQMATLLSAAPAELISPLALGAFSGVRAAELLRLDWHEVDLKRGYIQVLASKSKSARRRLIKIRPNLNAWLAPYAAASGPVWPKSVAKYYAGIVALCADTGLKWVDNGLRHSFASYGLAAAGAEINALALELGHTSTQMLFSNYREVATPEEAARYWEIRPKEGQPNVVKFAA